MKSRIFLAAGVVALAALALAQDTAKITWSPKAGTTAKYKLNVKPKFEGMDIDVNIDLTSKIVEIKDNGNVVVTETVDNVVLTMNGQEQAIGPQPGTTTTYTPLMEVVERKADGEGGMGDNPRFQESLVFLFPKDAVKVGDTWKRTYKGDASKGQVDSTTTYKYEGMESVGDWKCYKVSYDFAETTGSAKITCKGTVWLTTTDGGMVKAEYNMTNVEFQPGMPMDATAKIVRVN